MRFLYVVISIVVFLVAADYLVEVAPKSTPKEYTDWALALLALNLAPSLHYLVYRRKNIPLIPLVGFFYALSFAFPVFFIDLADYQLGYLSVDSLEVGFYGLLAFYVVYYISFFVMRNIKVFRPVKSLFVENTRFLRILMYSFLMVSVAGKILPGGALRHFYDPSIYIFAGIFLLLLLKGKLKPFEIAFLSSVILLEFASRLIIGLMAASMRYMLFLTIVYYLVRRRLPVIALGLGIAAYALMLPVKAEYGAVLEESGGTLTRTERLEIFYQLAIENYRESEKKESLYGKDDDEISPFWRFSYSSSALSRVMEMTPDPVPYWEGHTYQTLYSKLIPRFLWPGKPQENVGQEFGHRYNILDASDTETSMNLPWMAELYANWGRNAVFYGMAVFGFLFGFVDRFYNSGTAAINVVISAAIYFPIITQESNFALESGNMALLTVAIYYFVSFISSNTARKPNSS